jgi:hypothetical protein
MAIDGEVREIAFPVDNFDWSPQTIADQCRRRWSIEVFPLRN